MLGRNDSNTLQSRQAYLCSIQSLLTRILSQKRAGYFLISRQTQVRSGTGPLRALLLAILTRKKNAQLELNHSFERKTFLKRQLRGTRLASRGGQAGPGQAHSAVGVVQRRALRRRRRAPVLVQGPRARACRRPRAASPPTSLSSPPSRPRLARSARRVFFCSRPVALQAGKLRVAASSPVAGLNETLVAPVLPPLPRLFLGCRGCFIASLSLRRPCQAQPSCTAAVSCAAMPLYSGELLPRPAVPSCARPLSRPGLQGRHPAEHGAGEGTGQAWVEGDCGVAMTWPLSLCPLFPSSTT